MLKAYVCRKVIACAFLGGHARLPLGMHYSHSRGLALLAALPGESVTKILYNGRSPMDPSILCNRLYHG